MGEEIDGRGRWRRERQAKNPAKEEDGRRREKTREDERRREENNGGENLDEWKREGRGKTKRRDVLSCRARRREG
tara:strand:- start:194 stop:418 length:225 start_codon:yes stop_codon:yes gene_type:complete